MLRSASPLAQSAAGARGAAAAPGRHLPAPRARRAHQKIATVAHKYVEKAPAKNGRRPGPQPSRRLALAAPPLLWLPWRGCTQGGFYDTGVTENCQQIYQPAAAAEERLRQKMQAQARREGYVAAGGAGSSGSSSSSSDEAGKPAGKQGSSSLSSSASSGKGGGGGAGEEVASPRRGGGAERQQLLEEQLAYERAEIEAERAERTRKKVDEMWQGLE